MVAFAFLRCALLNKLSESIVRHVPVKSLSSSVNSSAQYTTRVRSFSCSAALLHGSAPQSPKIADAATDIQSAGSTKNAAGSSKSPSTRSGSMRLEDIELELLEGMSNPVQHKLNLNAAIFNEKGEVSSMPSYSKADICQMYSLQPRDLRKLGATGFSNILPAILVREKAILVNIEHIRAIVTASSVILFDPPQETQQHHVGFVYDLQRKLRMTNGFYEFRALEAILVNVINVIEVELEELLPKINELLEEFDGGVTPSSLSSLLNYRRQLTRLKQRVETNRDVLKQLLSASDDLASMYLMSKAMGTPRQISDDIEVELLMEHYIMMFDEMAYSVNEALNNVKSTEVVTGIVQDDHRNRLIMFELKATLCTVALSSGTFIATVFGMNIPSGLEEVNGSFATIGIVSCMISGVAMVWALRQLQGIKQSSVHIASGPHRGFPIWGGARRANSVAGIERAKILEASKDESKKLEVKPPVTPKDGKGKNLQDDKSSSTLKI